MTPAEFAQEWERCSPWLQAALDRGSNAETLAEVRESVVRGDAQFWCHPTAAAVTFVDSTARRKTLLIYLAGGSLEGLEAMVESAEAFARAVGCERMSLLGRKGWTRSFMARRGYQADAVLMVKEL